MEDLLFYIFSLLILGSGLMVVINPVSRNPVTSAMFLVLTIISLAGLFVLLRAYILAAVQILVYAGAVMVLFLFVIMLLDVQEEEQRKIRLFSGVLSVAAVGGLVLTFARALSQSELPTVVPTDATVPNAYGLGQLLFTHYLLPFEIMSVLLLVAMIGVILLSKKQLS